MDWLRKVKEWSKNLLTKVGLFRSEPAPVSRVVEAEVVERNALDAVARKTLALGPSELTEAPKDVFVDAFVVPSCSHDYRLLQQKWVKVAAKKFELRNEVRCSHCKEIAVTSIE